MEVLICDHCGTQVEGVGIQHRRRLFCGDECCEVFEDRVRDHVGPDAVDLERVEVLATDGLYEDGYLDDGDGDVVDDHLVNGDF